MDSSAEHLVAALARRVHALDPRALVIAESGMNDPKVVRGAERGGWGCDAAWADDFHHALRVALTGETDGWYEEFADLGTLAKAMHRPHVHDGTLLHLPRPPLRRAAPTTSRPSASSSSPPTTTRSATAPSAIACPSRRGRSPRCSRCLAPFTPMLFQGEEYGEVAPFRFFSDHIDPEIAEATREGRRREFAAFAAFGEEIPDPQDPMTFQRSKLTRRGEPAGLRALYRDALALRARAARGRAGGHRRTPTAGGSR